MIYELFIRTITQSQNLCLLPSNPLLWFRVLDTDAIKGPNQNQDFLEQRIQLSLCLHFNYENKRYTYWRKVLHTGAPVQ